MMPNKLRSMDWPARVTRDLDIGCVFDKCWKVPVWQWTQAFSQLLHLSN